MQSHVTIMIMITDITDIIITDIINIMNMNTDIITAMIMMNITRNIMKSIILNIIMKDIMKERMITIMGITGTRKDTMDTIMDTITMMNIIGLKGMVTEGVLNK